MKHAAPATPCSATAVDPPADRAGQSVPARIAALLHTIGILLGYGRHLADTVQHRAGRPGFSAIAVCFGTGRLATIVAHLQRGILRAVALQRVLHARAARGRDIQFTQPRVRTRLAAAEAADPAALPPLAATDPTAPSAATDAPSAAADPAPSLPEAPYVRKPARRRSRLRGWNDPELFMPTLEELEAQVRRRSFGRTIVDICMDLAVVPGFCTGAFWNVLFDSIRLHGGSVAVLTQERVRRQEAFSAEQDRQPGSDWSWEQMTRDGMRRVLGFFIGEPPVDPFAPPPAPALGPGVVAAATGPP